VTTLPPDIPASPVPTTGTQMAIWPPPTWATHTRVMISDGAVVHTFESTSYATVEPMMVGQEPPLINVELSQSDDLEVDAFGVPKVIRAEPIVMIDALQMSVAEARNLRLALGEVLAVAVDL
jgi:hypothetical protein